MKTTGIVFLVLGIISFLGGVLGGTGVFGPCFWIALGALLIYKGKERDEQKKKGKKSGEDCENLYGE